MDRNCYFHFKEAWSSQFADIINHVNDGIMIVKTTFKKLNKRNHNI